MINLSSTGSFKKTEDFLSKLMSNDLYSDLDRYGQMGVKALASATPMRTGLTAASWEYRIEKKRNKATIEWYNTNGNVAILLQYGHGTGTGGYVAGYDYINPAIRPVFSKIEDDFFRRVTSG